MKNLLLSSFICVLFSPFLSFVYADPVTRGGEVATAYMKELKGKLIAAMSEGGPVHAIEVCGTESAKLSAAYKSKFEDVLEVRRFSDRFRNPKNKPAKEEAEVLQGFREELQKGTGISDHVLIENGSTVRFFKPILLQSECLLCHGERDAMPEQLRSMLDSRYPDDKATGFSIGDLRGVITVTMSKP